MLEVVGLIAGQWGRAVSLQVADGEVCTLLGSNGAGKSTLLETIAGLAPDRGGLVRPGADGSEGRRGEGEVRPGIRIALEDRQVFSRLSVRRNLHLGAWANPNGAVLRRDLDWVLGLFPSLSETLDRPAGTLSGGQQTMLNVARALMGRPEVLLLDEPTLGLDPANVQRMLVAINQIRRERSVSILAAEQSGTLALAYPDNVLVMRSGEIVGRGSLQEVQTKGWHGQLAP